MSLLVDLWSTALEPGYRRETERREAERQDETRREAGPEAGPAPGPGGPRRRRGHVAAAAALALAGLLLGTAAAQAERAAPGSARARAGLLDRVAERTATGDALAAEVAALQAEVAREREAALAEGRAGRELAERLARLELLAGTTPVTGPGLRVVLDDAPPEADALAGPAGEEQPGRLLDRDLQDVVNALWAAGAEAVAVGGQRITAQSAISNAGEAVLVDFRPLLPPYAVEAVGDPATLEPAFVDSPTGRRFATYVSLLGITFDVQRADDLLLPAGTLRLPAAAPEPSPPAPDAPGAPS